MKTETCKALDMLERAETLEVDGHLINNWGLETLDCEHDDAVLRFNYSDDEEQLYFEFSFLKKDLLEASIVGHSISMVDSKGEMVEINCYTLTKLELN